LSWRYAGATAEDRCDLLCLNLPRAERLRAQGLDVHHLRTLRTAGLADSRREGRMVLYALTPAGRALLDAVLAEDVPA
jgi:DNA-binding transcriptional ArsR family regulator